MNKKKQFLLFSLVISSFPFTASSYSDSYLSGIFDRHLQSFPVIEQNEEPIFKPQPSIFTRIKEYIFPKEITFDIKKLTIQEKRELTFKTAPAQSRSNEHIIDETLLHKLKVVHGGEHPEKHLLARMTRAHSQEFIVTDFGKRTFIELISQPTADTKILHARQNIIKEFVFNESLQKKCRQIFKELKENESHILSFWQEEDSISKNLFEKVYFSKNLNIFNKNKYLLEFKTRLENFAATLPISAPVLFGWIEISLIHYFTSKEAGSRDYPSPLYKNQQEFFQRRIGNSAQNFISKEYFEAEHPIPLARSFKFGGKTVWEGMKRLPNGVKSAWNALDNNPDVKPQYRYLYKGLLLTPVALYSFMTYKSYLEAKQKKDIIDHLQTKMIGVAKYVRSAKKLLHILSQNTLITNNLSMYQTVQELVARSKNHSAKFNTLIGLLQSNTFTGNASFFSLSGKVLAAHQLMKEVKEEFESILKAIGEIDVYVGMAHLYKAHEHLESRYCFVDFIENDKPYFHAHQFWNPFINPEHVVTNDIEFGGDSCQNMILSGPNTGGKSTLIEAILIAALSAQTFGIAPAHTVVMTPFSQFTGYMNVTDDIAIGASRFKAEVMASKKQLDQASALQPHQFALNVRDEGIVGTDREVGERAESNFTQKLGSLPNSINLISTHYKMLTNLEDETSGQFKNYRMAITRNDDGTIQRHFKLEEGKNTINIALDILQEQGLA